MFGQFFGMRYVGVENKAWRDLCDQEGQEGIEGGGGGGLLFIKKYLGYMLSCAF